MAPAMMTALTTATNTARAVLTSRSNVVEYPTTLPPGSALTARLGDTSTPRCVGCQSVVTVTDHSAIRVPPTLADGLLVVQPFWCSTGTRIDAGTGAGDGVADGSCAKLPTFYSSRPEPAGPPLFLIAVSDPVLVEECAVFIDEATKSADAERDAKGRDETRARGNGCTSAGDGRQQARSGMLSRLWPYRGGGHRGEGADGADGEEGSTAGWAGTGGAGVSSIRSSHAGVAGISRSDSTSGSFHNRHLQLPHGGSGSGLEIDDGHFGAEAVLGIPRMLNPNLQTLAERNENLKYGCVHPKP